MSNPTGSTTMAEQQTWSRMASLFPGPFVPSVPAPGAPPQHVPFPASLCQYSWEARQAASLSLCETSRTGRRGVGRPFYLKKRDEPAQG